MRLAGSYRLLAVLVLVALAVPGIGATFVANEHENVSERCVSCTGCGNGDCGDESSPAPHDHCCQSACWSHTFWVLVVPYLIDQSGQSVNYLGPQDTSLLQIRSDSLYRPPRD